MKRNATGLRGLGALLLAVAMVLSLAACGGGSKFDASGYVDASMKLITTGDGEALKEFSGVAVTEDEESYNKEITEALETMVSGADTGSLPEDLQTKYQDLVKNLLSGISYTVGEATELNEGSAEGYEVALKIKPLQLNVADDLNKWVEDFQSNTSAEDIQEMGSDLNKLYEQVYGEIADLLNQAIEKQEYGEEKTFQIPVTKNQDGLYEMDESAFEQAMSNSFVTDVDDAIS